MLACLLVPFGALRREENDGKVSTKVTKIEKQEKGNIKKKTKTKNINDGKFCPDGSPRIPEKMKTCSAWDRQAQPKGTNQPKRAPEKNHGKILPTVRELALLSRGRRPPFIVRVGIGRSFLGSPVSSGMGLGSFSGLVVGLFVLRLCLARPSSG